MSGILNAPSFQSLFFTVLESAVEPGPELDVLRHDLRPEDGVAALPLGGGVVQRVGEVVVVGDEEAPQRVRLLGEPQHLALPLAVADEGPVLAAVDVLLVAWGVGYSVMLVTY